MSVLRATYPHPVRLLGNSWQGDRGKQPSLQASSPPRASSSGEWCSAVRAACT